MSKTSEQFDKIIETSRDIFIKKHKDYGSSWRIFRMESITDQIFIKAKRIRTLEEKESQVGEGSLGEYYAIVNYCIMALIQMELNDEENLDLSLDYAIELYNKHYTLSKELMLKKTHDYDEVWRIMRIKSLTDIILTKITRIKQIEDNGGKTIASEGVQSNYYDIMNYAIFALIKLVLENE